MADPALRHRTWPRGRRSGQRRARLRQDDSGQPACHGAEDPLFSQDVLTPSVADVLWVLLEDSPVGGVVEGWFGPDDARFVLEGLQGCGLDPATVPEVWCFSAQVEGSGAPLGLGPTVAVETGRGVGRADVVRIALRVGAC